MSTIGKISKYWSGFVNNIFTNTANFGIQVPVDLDVKIKAVMIGACFLLVSIPAKAKSSLSPVQSFFSYVHAYILEAVL